MHSKFQSMHSKRFKCVVIARYFRLYIAISRVPALENIIARAIVVIARARWHVARAKEQIARATTVPHPQNMPEPRQPIFVHCTGCFWSCHSTLVLQSTGTDAH